MSLLKFKIVSDSGIKSESSVVHSHLPSIIMDNYEYIKENYSPKKPEDYKGLCVNARNNLAMSFTNQKIGSVILHQARVALNLSHAAHSFLVFKTPGGKAYLVDTTFVQMFDHNPKGRLSMVINNTKVPVKAIVEPFSYHLFPQKWYENAQQLLTNGYIELDQDGLDMYKSVLSRQYPPVPIKIETLLKNTEDLDKIPDSFRT